MPENIAIGSYFVPLCSVFPESQLLKNKVTIPDAEGPIKVFIKALYVSTWLSPFTLNEHPALNEIHPNQIIIIPIPANGTFMSSSLSTSYNLCLFTHLVYYSESYLKGFLSDYYPFN